MAHEISATRIEETITIPAALLRRLIDAADGVANATYAFDRRPAIVALRNSAADVQDAIEARQQP